MGRAPEALHEQIRQRTLDYFDEYKIKWWLSRDEANIRRAAKVSGLPTGHLTSSQVACVNHHEPARKDEELALSSLGYACGSNLGTTMTATDPAPAAAAVPGNAVVMTAVSAAATSA